jgi:methyl-accepting chemotaxis protein
MKSRLSSTIWTLVLLNGVVGFIVLGLAFTAGKKAGEASLFDFGSPAGGTVLFAIVLALATAVILAWRFGALLGPVQALAEFSERMAAGDPRARAEVNSNDELGYIAENLNRAVARVSKATSNQDANDALQRSITELLSVINQVARGDLAQRGKVTNDALGNVTDSINYMLDNFTKVLERGRKAAMEVTACSNNILVAADEMQAGATQQDQEITNTSSAVEELTVSMKQVSNNAEASAEAARRALDAISNVVRQSAELVQEISLASKQQVRGTEGVAHAMQIISSITRQTSQGTRGTVATVSQLVKLSDQLNEALAQFRASSKAAAAHEESERPVPAGALR